MGIAKITRNYQVTLPKDIRTLKKLEEGDTIIFAIEGNRVDIVKMDEDIITSTAGLWRGSKETGLSYTKRIREDWKKRVGRYDRY